MSAPDHWMHSPDTHRTDWDAVYAEHGPGGHRKELHRGLALSLPDDVHAQVHDNSRPVSERAHLLLDHIQSRPGGMGRFWTGGEGVGRSYAMGAVRDEDRQNRSYQSTPVVVHAHVPERQHIETDPDKLFAQHTMSYHLDSQREVPLKPGTQMHIKGISWHAPKPDIEVRRPEGQLADLRADKPYYDDPSSDDHLWTRHNFEGGMKSTASRFCENCGAKSSPYFPRKNVNGQMWCPMCAQNRRSASVKMHPDLLESHRLFGSYHTTGGRILGVHHTAATMDEQEARMAHQPGWDYQSHFEPVHFAIQGARGYASKVGLPDPHEHGYDHVRQTADRVRSIGRTYDALPEHDPAALGHFHAMGREVAHQYDHLTNHMGVKVESVDHDPYKNVHEMVKDVNANKRLKVMSTAVTGGHPFFSDHQNDQFRAVHDFFGHAATGRDFDRHGEEAAYVAHSKMFTPHARAALASETRGQNASLILNGEFGPQKIAVLPHHMYDDSSLSPHIPRLGSASTPPVGSRSSAQEDAMPKLNTLNSLPLTALLPDGRVAVALRVGNGRICKHAHDSGDGETLFHCPFCGSGQVIARNDGSTECEFCFAGETRYLTWDGVKTFAETVGTTQKVLSSITFRTKVLNGRSRLGQPKLTEAEVVQIRDLYAAGTLKAELARKFNISQGIIKKIVERTSWQHVGGGGHEGGSRATQEAVYGDGHNAFGGVWVDAEIKSFGVQPLMKVTLNRHGRIKEVFATASHRWYVNPRSRAGFKHDHKVVLATSELAPGSRLAPLFARTRLRQNTLTRPSPFGIAHGFTFGDGNLTGRGGSQVTMWGDKDLALLPYFAASHTVPTENQNGTGGIVVKDLPAFFKRMPDQDESLSYLYGWLAGYFAADGTVQSGGNVSLSCADPAVLQQVRDLCERLAIGTYGLKRTSRIGLGQTEPSDLWTVSFVASTLTSDFFVIPEHRARFDARAGVQDQVGWTVVSVEETDRVEEVFCAVVPGEENFTLEDNINVMNCTTAFTVQVQPQMPAFPQTIDGQPVDVPGMPNGGRDANVPPGTAPVGGDDPTDPDADPSDPDAAQVPPGEDGDPEDADDDGGDDKPAFLKGSALLYRTASGRVLNETQYMRHLAITHANDPAKVLAKIRAENTRG